MDFFAHQEQAQRKTTQLLALYALAVAAIVLAVYAVFSMALHQGLYWDAELFAAVAGGTVLVVATGSLIKTSELSQGGRAVAEALGGQRVDSAGADPNARKLINIVEEMAIASGIPVPPVYIMEEEAGINAFAAGYAPGDAVVAVTRGALQQLTRDELQGVMAHEFSHILTGDMRLNVRLIGVLHGILAIALVGYGAMRLAPYFSGGNRNRDSKGGNAGLGIMAAMFAIGLALIIIGYIGVFFSNLIKSAVSRQREFRADAGAVQFTRNPPGLGGALLRIAGYKPQGQLAHHGAPQASHMFFVNGVRSFAASLFATHPPLEQRVQRILPDFKGNYEQYGAALATGKISASPPPENAAAFNASPAQIKPMVGAPQPEDMANAAEYLAAIPGTLAIAAREPFGASALLYSLLLDADPTVRTRQLHELAQSTPAALVTEVRRLSPLLGNLAPHMRLPLASLSMPALRALSPQQYKQLRATVYALTTADARLSVFEFALQRMLLRHLARTFNQPPPPAPQISNIAKLQAPLSTVLQVLAAAGEPDSSRAHSAFKTALQHLLPTAQDAATPSDPPTLGELDNALDHLANATPQLKRSIVAACVDCAATDGKLAVAEYELLRAITDSLDCPLPPLKLSRA